MFVTLTPNLTRLIVHIPEGEVGDGMKATVGLGYHAEWADLDAPEMLDGREWGADRFYLRASRNMNA